MNEIFEFCRAVGNQPLLVQGAGGNVSQKINGMLFIKASGTRLDSASDTTFLGLEQEAVLRWPIDGSNLPTTEGLLKPSIETQMHAIIPAPVVVHLHSVDSLAWLVRADSKTWCSEAFASEPSVCYVDYARPGAPLAIAVASALQANKAETRVWLLANHGVVVAAESIQQAAATLEWLMERLREPPRNLQPRRCLESANAPENYRESIYDSVGDLVRIPGLFSRLEEDWALWPDHVVFLGRQPVVITDWNDPVMDQQPRVVFHKDQGVFVRNNSPTVVDEQLRCYRDVLIRIDPETRLRSLRRDEIDELLEWDLEQERKALQGFEDA